MSIDPYQPPKAITAEVDYTQLTEPAYSDGVDLLFTKEFKSPSVCVATGSTALVTNAKFFSHPLWPYKIIEKPWIKYVYFAVVAAILGLIHTNFESTMAVPLIAILVNILIFITNKKSSRIRLCMLKKVSGRFFFKIFLCTIPIILGLNLMFFDYTIYESNMLLLIVGSIITLGGFTLLLSMKKIYPKPISKHGDYYRLRGAHPDFLAHFPAVPR